MWVSLCLVLTLSESKISPSEYTVEHNKRRCLHGVRDVLWDPSVARSAQKHADECIFEHTDPAVYGECLWAGYFSPTAEDCLIGWYDNEIGDYPWDRPGYYIATGHFTQVVWANTRELGCGLCDGWGRGQYPYMVTCQYNLGGNVGGQYANMVKPVTKTAAECKADCGPPNQRGWDFSGCSTKFPGKCDPKCRTGYWSPRDIYALCQSDGTWWFDGICNANTCHSPLPSHPDPNVDMSSCMNGTGLEHEGTCAAKCKVGFFGDPIIVCQANARWAYGGSCLPTPGDRTDTSVGNSTNGTDPNVNDAVNVTDPSCENCTALGAGNGTDPGAINVTDPSCANCTALGAGNGTDPGAVNVTNPTLGRCPDLDVCNGVDLGDGNTTGPSVVNATKFRNQTLVVDGFIVVAVFCDGVTDGYLEVPEDGVGDSLQCDCPRTCTMRNYNPATVCSCGMLICIAQEIS